MNANMTRMVFPIANKPWYASINQESPDIEAVYVYDIHSKNDYEGNPTAIYCGTISRQQGRHLFELCKPQKIR